MSTPTTERQETSGCLRISVLDVSAAIEVVSALRSDRRRRGVWSQGPKAWYMTVEGAYPTPDEWQAAAEKHAGSWWEDWAEWAAQQGGPMVDPPRMGSETYPVLGDGPGEYVHG